MDERIFLSIIQNEQALDPFWVRKVRTMAWAHDHHTPGECGLCCDKRWGLIRSLFEELLDNNPDLQERIIDLETLFV